MHSNQCHSIKSRKFPKCRCPYACINGSKFCGRHLRMKNPILFVCEKVVKSDDYDYDYIIKSSRLPFEMTDYSTLQKSFEYYGLQYIKEASLRDSYSHLIRHIKLHENLTDIDKKNIVKIQSIFKGNLIRKRKRCCNKRSLLTLDPILEIDNKYYIQIKDGDEEYGFDLRFLYEHIVVNKQRFNPYKPGSKFSDIAILKIEEYFLYCNKKNIKLKVEKDIESLTDEQKFNLKVVEIFHKIDELGNLTQSSWFMNLSFNQLKDFYIQFEDLWNYRLQIPVGQKKKMVNNGILFTVSVQSVKNYCSNDNSKKLLQSLLLNIIERIITEGETVEEKKLGALYTLTALVIVSQGAAESYPFLVQPI